MKGLFSVIASFMLLGSSLVAAERRLDLRGEEAGRSGRTLASVAPAEKGVLRQTRLSAGAAALPPLAVGDALALTLFDDVERTVVLKERLESPVGGDAFIATVDGGDGLVSAAVVQTENGILVDLQDVGKGRVYTVASSAEATLVRELDPKAGTVTPCRARVPKLTSCAVETAAPGRALSAPPSVEQPSTVVDILVAYDTGATAWAKANGGGLEDFALVAVTKMNAALANNGLDEHFRFRLVGTMEVAATSDDVEAAIDEIEADKPGWSAIRTKRDEVGADVVTVLVDTGYAFGTTGVGCSLTKENYATFADSAYNVCAIRAVAIDHTMTHEVGHNMGAGHATAVNPSQIVPGPQLHDYSSGFHFTAAGTAYHTIMAYNSDGWGGTYELAPLFSSPTATWLGATAGDATHDNARTLLSTCAYVANWRAQKIPLSYDVFISPATETLFDESVMVTLTPGKAGLEIRYTMDGSKPTLTSSLYSSPLKLTRTTTVKAAAVYGGRLGPVFTARYLKRDLATALNAPQLEWTTSPDYPWVAQTENAFDGFAAMSCPEFTNSVGCGKTSWLKTTVTGPTEMGFRYQKAQYTSSFKVYCDDTVVWSDGADGHEVGGTGWRQTVVNLPEGTHEIRFAFEHGGGYWQKIFNGIVLDTVCFDAWSASPTIEPATTAEQATAKTFTGSMTITLTPPPGRTGLLRYTLDGTDPTLGGATTYTGPITVDRSVFVQAVFVEPGREASASARGYFLERHPVKPGEWTTDVEGVKEAAANDGGRLIAVLLAHRADCGWTKKFMPVAESPEFLTWAAANGVYLITADSSQLVDTEAANGYFWNLYGGQSAWYPMLVFADPARPDQVLDWWLVRKNNGSGVGGVLYEDTVESLVRGFAAAMGEASVPAAPTVSPEAELVNSFPLEVTLENTNGYGVIYYTLDGSVPTPENGAQYAGPIRITDKEAVLCAAVKTDSGLYGIPLVRRFRLTSDYVNGCLRTRDVDWKVTGSVGWQECDVDGARAVRTGGYLNGRQYVSTLTARVSGKGRFKFSYKFCNWNGDNTMQYSVNGIVRKCVERAVYTDYVMDTVELDIDGDTTVEWAYVVTNPSVDYTSSYTSDGKSAWCGLWLYDVSWIPDAQSTTTTPVAVPYVWIADRFPAAAVATFETLMEEDSDGDGYLNWQEYLCGTDPNAAGEGEGSVPRCTIEVVDGIPKVGHNIRIPGAAQSEGWRAVLKGSADFKDWTEADESAHRFFKVVVEKN